MRTISLRLAQTGGALVSWAQKKAMNDREFGVKENAKKTGAFDDIFGMLVEGAGCKGGFRSVSARLVTKECEATSERSEPINTIH